MKIVKRGEVLYRKNVVIQPKLYGELSDKELGRMDWKYVTVRSMPRNVSN